MYKFIIPAAIALASFTACTPSEASQEQTAVDSVTTDSLVVIVDSVAVDTAASDSVK